MANPMIRRAFESKFRPAQCISDFYDADSDRYYGASDQRDYEEFKRGWYAALQVERLTPVEVVRDSNGNWWHPVFSKYWDDHLSDIDVPSAEQWQALLNHFGIEVTTVSLEFDAPEEMVKRYFDADAPDFSFWNPTTPTGDGWFLISIADTEDGPAAWFARDKAPAEVSDAN